MGCTTSDKTLARIAGLSYLSLWRWGLAVHLLYLVPAIVVNVIICGLFKLVQPTLARLALVFAVAGVTIEAVSLLHLYLPLAMVEERSALAALGEGQREALADLVIRLFSTGFGFALSPALSDLLVPGILLPSLLGELSLALWLVVKRVKLQAPEAHLPRPAMR